MTQVKYDSINKYIQCHCNKKQMIQLGWGINLYVNSVMQAVCAGALVLVSVLVPASTAVLLPLGFVSAFILLDWWTYHDSFKAMMKKGHTRACSKKVALKAMWYWGQYSNFRVNVDPKEIDPRGDYGTSVFGLWILVSIINGIFFFLFSYSIETSAIFPVLFVISIIASIVMLIRVKDMAGIFVTLCMLNIFTSSLLLLLCLVDLAQVT